MKPALFFLLAVSAFAADKVILTDTTITIPTYPAGPPDTTPLFFDGRGYQGAKGPIYPYPIIDRLSDQKVDKPYRELCLENQYVKFCVLPELGGRIFTGLDKTDNYNFFYQQHVIKPALIGMTGAWISGGVEWDIPHHHRASSFMPVEVSTEEHPDGSKTIYVGELELRHRMHWTMGLTLYPGRSYIEAVMRLRNTTPISNTFLYFANVAVHADNDYQIIFPPDTQFAVQHAKVEFSRWPIADGEYGGVDFSRGVDVSWYRNHPESSSMFAFDSKEDFLAGYNHGRKAGTLHIADHGIVPGKKFFTWGTGDDGRVWGNLLTDTDGPYLELMVGSYSDNQPDYSWIQPYETRTVRQYWYPYREIGAVKDANIDAAVNVEPAGEKVRIGFHVTAAYDHAHVLLRAGPKVLLDKAISINPATPFTTEVEMPDGYGEQDLEASLSADTRTLIDYRPRVYAKQPMPAPVTPPPPPAEVKTNEDLYLDGLRLQQFYSPAAEPYPYFEEALRRDPGDARANTALGILYYRRAMYNEAERHLSAAVARLSRNYTSPKDGESLYYLGLTQKALGQYDAAWESLEKASWSSAWRDAADFTLAELATRRGDFARALEFVDQSLEVDALNSRALALKAALHHHPPSIPATANIQDRIEFAADDSSAGLYGDAIASLKSVDTSFPMAYYWLAWLSGKQGDPAAEKRYDEQAARLSSDYCFPFRIESIEVLRRAMEVNPADDRAPYYLGNLLYDIQPEEAIKAWERSRDIDPGFALTHRNLAFAYARVLHDPRRAQASMEKAVALDARPRFVVELDQINASLGVRPADRLAVFDAHPEAARQRDDAMAHVIRLHILLGHYDQAIEMLSTRKFNVWEGGENMAHDEWVDAHLLHGDREFHQSRYADALKDYEAALEYPENLAVGRPLGGGRSAVAYWFVALTEKRLGNNAAAHDALAKAVAENGSVDRPSAATDESAEIAFYQAQAWRELGNTMKADAISSVLDNDRTRVDYFAKFRGERAGSNDAHVHYVLALACLTRGDTDHARSELDAALKADPSHEGAKRQLDLLSDHRPSSH